mmetsp:Transcript_76548/g.211448  ORF Transcript_76548/g.211448 Transcript_76548/m.211448 type:complete len:207 (-) Transcript_76548:77-697(-)
MPECAHALPLRPRAQRLRSGDRVEALPAPRSGLRALPLPVPHGASHGPVRPCGPRAPRLQALPALARRPRRGGGVGPRRRARDPRRLVAPRADPHGGLRLCELLVRGRAARTAWSRPAPGVSRPGPVGARGGAAAGLRLGCAARAWGAGPAPRHARRRGAQAGPRGGAAVLLPALAPGARPGAIDRAALRTGPGGRRALRRACAQV